MRYARRRVDDEDWDAYDPKYFPKKVFKDGRGPSVRLYMTDAARARRMPVLDARVGRPGYVTDKLAVMGGRQALSDAALTDARRRCDDAYRAACWRTSEAWRSVPLLPAVHDAQEARARYIDQISNAWRTPTVRRDLRRTDTTANGGRFVAGPLSGGPDSSWRPNETTASQRRGARPPDDDDQDGDDLGNGADYTTDPDDDTDPYARSVWAAQNAIENGGPDSADENEAMLRRMSGYQPGATGASVGRENARYRGATDAQAARDRAYSEMVTRLGDAWRRP
jgi:hypothetical protein